MKTAIALQANQSLLYCFTCCYAMFDCCYARIDCCSCDSVYLLIALFERKMCMTCCLRMACCWFMSDWSDVQIRLLKCFVGDLGLYFHSKKPLLSSIRSSYLNPVYQEMAGGHITDSIVLTYKPQYRKCVSMT